MRHLLLAGLIACALPAAAQQACASRAEIVAHLASEYGEHCVAAGLRDGSVTEVFASADGETWTIIVTRPDGMACAVAAGEAWMSEAPHQPGQDG